MRNPLKTIFSRLGGGDPRVFTTQGAEWSAVPGLDGPDIGRAVNGAHRTLSLIARHIARSGKTVFLVDLSNLAEDSDTVITLHGHILDALGHHGTSPLELAELQPLVFALAMPESDPQKAGATCLQTIAAMVEKATGACVVDLAAGISALELSDAGHLTSIPVSDSGRAPAPEALPAAMPGDIRFVYRPLIEVFSGLASLFLCLPIRRQEEVRLDLPPDLQRADLPLPPPPERASPNGGFDSGYAVLDPDPTPPRLLGLDLLALRRVAEDISHLHADREEATVLLPVSFDSLADPRRRLCYAHACERLIEQRSANLIFEIVDIPDDIRQHQLVNACAPLLLFGRQVFGRVPLGRSDFAGYRAAGLSAVGVDVYTLALDEGEIARSLESMAGHANGWMLKTYVHGVRSVSLCTIAGSGGFDCIGGHALSGVFRNPQKPAIYDFHKLYLNVS